MGLGPCACSRCWLLMLMKEYYVGTTDWGTEDGPTDCVGENGPTDCVGDDGVTSENDASGLNVWVKKLIVCSWWAAEMGVVVWATEMGVVVWATEMGVVVLVDEMGVVVWAAEMGVVVWATDMGVVVWATDIGVVSVTVVASLNWMGGTLILLLGSDGGDRRCDVDVAGAAHVDVASESE
uniref:Uncharacterized protein n=1 Tax=Fagus sylvatica TaxID=28930 RepID=A0A2N9J6G2_FAGSY